MGLRLWFVVIALLYGIGVALSASFMLDSHAWFLVPIVAASLFAVIVQFPFRWAVRQWQQPRSGMATLEIGAALAWSGGMVVAAFLTMSAFWKIPGGWWEMVPPPATGVQRIAGVDRREGERSYEVVVSDSTQTLQALYCGTPRLSDCRWEALSALPPADIRGMNCFIPPNAINAPPFPLPITEEQGWAHCISDDRYQWEGYYVLQVGGTLWRWNIGVLPFPIGRLFILTMVAVGALGLVAYRGKRNGEVEMETNPSFQEEGKPSRMDDIAPYWIIATIIYGLSWVFSYQYSQWHHNFLTFLITGGIFSLLVGIPLLGFVAMMRQQGSQPGCGLVALLVMGVGAIASVIAGYGMLGNREWARGAWEAFMTPPEAVAAIVHGPSREHEFYIRSTEGNLFGACSGRYTCQWEAVQSVPDEAYVDPFCAGRVPPNETPPSKGKVIGSAIRMVCGPDGYIQINYELTEDGRLWKYRYSQVPDFGFGFIASAAWAILLAGMVGVRMMVVYGDARPAVRGKE